MKQLLARVYYLSSKLAFIVAAEGGGKEIICRLMPENQASEL